MWFDVFVERFSDGFFIASVLALAGCQGPLYELMESIRDAAELCPEVEKDDFEQICYLSFQSPT